MFLRAFGNYDTDAASKAVGLEFKGDSAKSVTQQSFKDECDINKILERFGLTGEMPENPRLPQSGDFTGVSDFHTAMTAVRKAEEGFLELPANLRARFGNDPQNLLEFLEDVKNKDEAVKLGLVEKPPERTRDVVQAVDELAAAMKPKA